MRMTAAYPGSRTSAAAALSAALLLHGLLLSLWHQRDSAAKAVAAPRARPLQLLDAKSVARALQQARYKRPPSATPAGPVVDLPPPKQVQRPQKPRFSAEHDHAAKTESKSRDAQLQPAALAAEATAKQRAANASVPSASAPAGRVQASSPLERAPDAVAADAARQAPMLRLRLPGTARGRAAEAEGRRASAAPLGPRRALTAADLFLSPARLASLDAAPMADIVDDTVADAERTELNAAAFRFASFHNRLKERVAAHWRPLEALQRSGDPSGARLGGADRVTVLRVELNAQGNIVALETLRSAGVEALDEAARNAFCAGQPYSHPPRSMLDASGHVAFDFAFSLETRRGGLFDGP